MSNFISPGYAPRLRARSLDEVPASPGTYDDEFNAGPAFPSGWTRRGNWNDVNAIDQYASFSSPTGARWSHNSLRPSWLVVQPDTSSGSGNVAEITKSVSSLPTNYMFWARFSFNFRFNAVTASDSRIGVTLHASSAGAPDDANRSFTLFNVPQTNTILCSAGKIVSNVSTQVQTTNTGPVTAGTDSRMQHACYAGVQVLGTTHNYFLGWPGGNWVFVTSQTFAPTVAFVTLSFLNASTAAPGNMLVGCDFIRYFAGRYLP